MVLALFVLATCPSPQMHLTIASVLLSSTSLAQLVYALLRSAFSARLTMNALYVLLDTLSLEQSASRSATSPIVSLALSTINAPHALAT